MAPSSGFGDWRDAGVPGQGLSRMVAKGTAATMGPRREPRCGAPWEGVLEEGAGTALWAPGRWNRHWLLRQEPLCSIWSA